jgi:hypothetical protein
LLLRLNMPAAPMSFLSPFTKQIHPGRGENPSGMRFRMSVQAGCLFRTRFRPAKSAYAAAEMSSRPIGAAVSIAFCSFSKARISI